MASSLRELRQRRRSVSTTKKITRAMELIAASRVVKAQQAARAAAPYTRELTQAVSALASVEDLDHPLLRDVEKPRRSAMLLITSDRGLAGAYSTNAIKAAEQLHAKIIQEGQENVQYITGSKGVAYFDFRNRHIEQSWTGFSDRPTYANAKEIADVLIERFLRPYEEGGVDQLHIVGTRFVSMMTQTAVAVRLLPLVVEDAPSGYVDSAEETHPFYEFEPDARTVLDRLLPLFVANRIHTALLQSAASELANRQRAMKSATDNAQELIEKLTRAENQARQAGITQEITEIVGGASALAESAGNE
ncbi:F0F1 ATP synthase subunit gamma [Tessaracoccus sp. MC1865]|uniref:F0F1 ATP synthase subunit gamma n=1 Tax=Tessaracoccus sp. MC1865 TaxID=2760310 RepID=UPI001600C58C|nr:F0F1 ATP synthase subunit gamma [Tessaracoccus sp. MC1865]MBB1483452.1 F0F1 ATP synthase subunit gamma [Tessaracoccus sp. MC1865]QTO36552.1 F0F1 ATP synthase subunit gamma [Tessaracoccus sp. MC1865]